MSSKSLKRQREENYGRMSRNGVYYEQQFLSACKAYLDSDMNFRVIARTYNIVPRAFLKKLKRLYFYNENGVNVENSLSIEELEGILNKLINFDKMIKKEEIDRIDELKVEYKNLVNRKNVYCLVLKKDPKNESFKNKIQDTDLRIKSIECDDVFVK